MSSIAKRPRPQNLIERAREETHAVFGAVPFATAEEAWHWYCITQAFAGLPKRLWPSYFTTIPRPCEPCEIFGVVSQAYRAGVLTKDHMEVLNRSTTPGSHSLTPRDVAYFDAAMAAIEWRLQKKGIVA